MVSPQFKTTLILLMMGFFCGFIFSLFFTGCGSDSPVTPPVTTTKTLQQSENKNHDQHQAEKHKLDSINHRLQTELTSTKQALAVVRKKAVQSKTAITNKWLSRGTPVTDLVRSHSIQPDSTNSNDCDSILAEVANYITANDTKDSLYEKQISTLDSVVLTQTVIIKNDSVAYSDLRVLFTEAIDNSKVLEKNNFQLRRKLKNQKVKSRIVTAGLMLLSGAVTNYFLKR